MNQTKSASRQILGIYVAVGASGLIAACSGEDYPAHQFETPEVEEPATLGPEVDGPIVIPRSEEMGDSDAEPEPPAIALSLCETSAGESVSTAKGAVLLDDFEDGDDRFSGNGREGTWYDYGDEYGSLLSGSSLAASPGRGGSAFALYSGGTGFTDWGSGMGTVLSADSSGPCLHDLSVYSGITFWARGQVETQDDANVIDQDQGVVKLLLTEADVVPLENGGACDNKSGACWDSRKGRFEPDECWKRFSFDFSELVQDGWGQDGAELDLNEMYNVGFEVGAHNDWELWVDDVEFYTGDKPETAEDCNVEVGLGGASGQL